MSIQYQLFNNQRKKIAEFANSVDLDDHSEPPHLDLAVCSLVFEFSIWYRLDITFFENLQTKILLLVVKRVNKGNRNVCLYISALGSSLS